MIRSVRRFPLNSAAQKMIKRTVVSSSSVNPISSGSSQSVDDSRDYVKNHQYPQKGQYVPSETEPNPSTGRPVPLNVLLTKYAPMKHPITHGDNVCDLQLRSFFTDDLEFFCNFVLRVAFYLKIPVKGVTPLPRKNEKWTVIKSPFVHAKSKENFERRTHKRLIQLYDTNPDVVQVFLATVRKYCIPGVGMKASVYQNEDLNVLDRMDSTEAGAQPGSILGSGITESAASSATFEGIDGELAAAVKEILESPEFKPLMETHEETNEKDAKSD